MSGDLAAALQIAIKVHADQCDKQGDPYLLHVLRVVEAVSDEAKVVAALHDVLEDGPAEMWNVLNDDDWLSGSELGAVELLTRLDGVEYARYIDNIAKGTGYPARAARLAREVKLADIRDNLGRIPPRPPSIAAHPFTRQWEAERQAAWDSRWASLKARYTKALATLEATQ